LEHTESSFDFDDLLDELVGISNDEAESRVIELQPRVLAERPNWWLGMMEAAEMRVHAAAMSKSDSSP
jgi:hypothetical protein